MLMAVILLRAGYEIREENRSFAALQTAREFRPDLILLDVDMPGKDGGAVSAEIARDPLVTGTPIVFVTSLVSEHESGMRGGVRFLAKPVEPKALLAAAAEALARRAAAAC